MSAPKRASRLRDPQGRDFQCGDIYAFRTAPATELSVRETGRYAALKILGLDGGRITYVVLEGIFDRFPQREDVERLRPLICERFSFSGAPAMLGSPVSWDVDLDDFRYVSTMSLTAEDAALLAQNRSFGLWSGASSHAEGEWRWRHDRVAFIDEVRRSQQVRDARLAAERERYQTRLKTLTWEKFLAEQPFGRWEKSPPFPPPAFTTAARERILETALGLQALGSRPKKADVRRLLKECVEWFNAKDEEFGRVIETEEREDICRVIEELAFVARHASLGREADGWRNW